MQVQKSIVKAEPPSWRIVRVQFLFRNQKDSGTPRRGGMFYNSVLKHLIYLFLDDGTHAGHDRTGGVHLRSGIARVYRYTKPRGVHFSGALIVDRE